MSNPHKIDRLFRQKIKARLEVYFLFLQIFLTVIQVFVLIRA